MSATKSSLLVYRYITLIILLILLVPAGISLKAQEGEIRRGGTLRLALSTDVTTTNPFLVSLIQDFDLMRMIYPCMTRTGPDGLPHGDLAESWEVSPDGKSITFHLVKNATWHDGTPITSKDVRFTFEYAGEHGFLTSITDNIERIETPDNYTITFYFKEPDANIIDNPWMDWPYIIPEHIWKDIEKPEEFENPAPIVGGGPFQLVERVPKQYLKLKAYDNYYHGRPYIDEILIKIVPRGTITLALLKNEIDLCKIDAAEVARVSADPNIKISVRNSTHIVQLAFNNLRYPTNLTKFRQAMAYAIDTKEIAEVAYSGYATPGNPGFLPTVFEYWLNKEIQDMYDYDPERAKQILDELNFIDRDGDGIRETPNGTKLDFSIWIGPDPLRVRAAELMQEDLAEVGIRISIETMEWRTLFSGKEDPTKWWLFIGGWRVHSPADLRGIFVIENGSNSEIWWHDEYAKEFLRLTEEWTRTFDAKKRREQVFKMQELIAKGLPYYTLVHDYDIFAYRIDQFEGWTFVMGYGYNNYYTWMNLHLKGEVITKPVVEVEKVIPTWVYGLAVIAVIAIIAGAVLALKRK